MRLVVEPETDNNDLLVESASLCCIVVNSVLLEMHLKQHAVYNVADSANCRASESLHPAYRPRAQA